MNYKQWLDTEDGRLAAEAIRDHVSMMSRNAVEAALRLAFEDGRMSAKIETGRKVE